MNKTLLVIPLVFFLLSSCIKDDIVFDTVDPVLRITSSVDSIALNTTFQLDFNYLNNVGQQETVNAIWSSANPAIISVNNNGLATGLQVGTTILSVSYENEGTTLQDDITITVGDNTVITTTTKNGIVATTSSYALTGAFTLSEDGNNIILDFGADYEASTALPGLFVYLSNNPSTIAGAYEIGAVTVFSGVHNYTIPNVGINDYQYVLYFCKPFNVKVGDGEIMD